MKFSGTGNSEKTHKISKHKHVNGIPVLNWGEMRVSQVTIGFGFAPDSGWKNCVCFAFERLPIMGTYISCFFWVISSAQNARNTDQARIENRFM